MSKRLLLLNLLLVTAAVALSVQIVRILLASPQLPAAPPVTAPQAERTPTEETVRAGPPLATYDVVAARNLFSPSRSETAAAAAVPVVKPLLYGIVLKDGTPLAFLEDPITRKVAEYKTGDQVPGGQLERIEADRVVIRRSEGTFEVLLRDPARLKAAVTGQLAPQPPPPVGSPQVQVPPTPAAPGSAPPTLFRRPQGPAIPPVRTAPSP